MAHTAVWCPECKRHRAIFVIRNGHHVLDCATSELVTRFHAVPNDEVTGMTIAEVM